MTTIDEGIADGWPADIFEKLRDYRLGLLIKHPPLSFHGTGDPERQLWSPADGDRPSTDGQVDVPAAEYGVITTQTCNIAERPPKGTFPWVQISPVYKLDDADDVGDRLYLHSLSPPDLPPGNWVADLRLEAPVEKSVLVQHTPVPAFSSEDEEIAFGEMLGRQRDRAALHDNVNNVLYGRWRKKRSNNKPRAGRVFDEIHMVGLLIEDGSRLEPVAVECHFIGRGGELSDEAKDWLETWWDKAREEANAADPSLNLLPNQYHDGSAMDLELYDRLIPLENWLET